jgi:hypothetical protein
MTNWPEREAKLLLGTKIHYEEGIGLRLLSDDAHIYASVASLH